jgi:hypothetical protein
MGHAFRAAQEHIFRDRAASGTRRIAPAVANGGPICHLHARATPPTMVPVARFVVAEERSSDDRRREAADVSPRVVGDKK